MNSVVFESRLKVFRLCGQIAREGDGYDASAKALDRGSGPVRGKFQHRRRPGQPLLPITDLSLEQLSGQPLTLPVGEVGVLDRQVRQVVRLSL